MHCKLSQRGFTLIEVLIVVLLISVVAASAISHFHASSEDAAVGATIETVNRIHRIADVIHARTGEWPRDAHSGRFPEDFEGYLDPCFFECKPPVGGIWDWNGEDLWGDVYAGMSIKRSGSFSSVRDVWRAIDERIDDGDLSSGNVFTYHSNRFLIFRLVR